MNENIEKKLQNIQSELAYTTDDTYLFNYKNKEKDLNKLLYKLSRYEKIRKKIKNDKKKKKLQKIIKRQIPEQETLEQETLEKETEKQKTVEQMATKKEKIEKKGKKTRKIKKTKKTQNNIVGGTIENIPTLLFVPVAGGIMVEPNYIKLHNNSNLYHDLVLFIINNIINVAELGCLIYIYNSYINNISISFETIIVIIIIYITRVIISMCIYKKKINSSKNENENKKDKISEDTTKVKNINNIMLIILFSIPLLILLMNMQKYDLIDNIIVTCVITILLLPYFRLLYINFINKSTNLINIAEKIIIALLLLIIIQNNFDMNSIIHNIKHLNSNTNINNKININNSTNVDDNILLNNFNNLFNK